MKRKYRTQVLVKASEQFLKKCCEIIEKQVQVKVIEEPTTSLVMVKTRESSKNSLFYLGEVVVSECRVEINGQIGIGIVQDIQLEKAKLMAIIDAAYNAKLELKNELNVLIEEYAKKQEVEQNEVAKAILRTRVSFETMDV